MSRNWTTLPTWCPKPFFSPPQMSRLIYFNESFWLRRECRLAVQQLLIHLAAVWMFSLLWVCCFLRLYWMAKEQLRPGLVKNGSICILWSFHWLARLWQGRFRWFAGGREAALIDHVREQVTWWPSRCLWVVPALSTLLREGIVCHV